MKLKKIFLALSIMTLSIGTTLTYLLQPSGHIGDFSTLQPDASSTISDGLKVHFFGVSTLLFDNGQEQILIDGFFSRPSLWQVLTSKLSSNSNLISDLIQQYELHRTQAVVVSHSHYDHALDLAEIAKQLPQSIIMGSTSSLNIVQNQPQIKTSQLQTVKPWMPQKFNHFQITAIPSQHTPPTLVNNDLGEKITHSFHLPAKFSEFKEGGSFDYLIEHQGQRILVKASTGFIPKQYQNMQVDVLFLGIAQLSKQSKQYQQQYLNETLATLKPKLVIPIHWDDFFQPLDSSLIFLPRFADNVPRSLEILIQAAQQQHTKVTLLTKPEAFNLSSYRLHK